MASSGSHHAVAMASPRPHEVPRAIERDTIYFRKECTEKTLLRDNATKWLEICTEEEKKKRKIKVRVDRDTLCMDTRIHCWRVSALLHAIITSATPCTHYFRTLSHDHYQSS